MELDLVRYGHAWTSTLGRLFIGASPQCFMLEDERREVKVPGQTRIPEGRYRLTLRKFGSWHERMLKKHGAFHRGMIELLDVPKFSDVLVHPGNTELDTAGCLLPGVAALVHGVTGEFTVARSTEAYIRLYDKVASELLDGAEVWLTVSSRS